MEEYRSRGKKPKKTTAVQQHSEINRPDAKQPEGEKQQKAKETEGGSRIADKAQSIIAEPVAKPSSRKPPLKYLQGNHAKNQKF